MSKFKEGMIIKAGSVSRVVLGVCGRLVAVGKITDIDSVDGWYTESKLLEFGYAPVEETWRPVQGDPYQCVTTFGNSCAQIWNGTEADLYCLSVGNCFPLYCDDSVIEAYKAKLKEVFKEQ